MLGIIKMFYPTGGGCLARIVLRETVLRMCVLCGAMHEKRDWPAPYGADYIYGGVCESCLGRQPESGAAAP